MREFELRRGHFKKIGGSAGIEAEMRSAFGNVKGSGGALESSYGALISISVKVLSPDKISVDTRTDAKVGAEVASDTMRKYNEFMERVTGLTASERAKRAQKAAKKAKI